ncbi:MAG: ATP-dependent helicase, partial [Nitrospirota bacterium]|nr:ATP-dependent helicase [Nitrospirota bacterium]
MTHDHSQLLMFGSVPPPTPEVRGSAFLRQCLPRIADPLELNPTQLEVVTAPFGPILVIAGAGSGKTKVLARRAAWYIGHGIPPKQILSITFTRKAAHEMLSRVQDINPLPKYKIDGGTFHSKAHHWLRLFGSAIGLSPRFTLMDEGDTTGMLHLLASKQRLTGIKGFPDKRTLLTLFGHAANSMTRVADTIESIAPQFQSHTTQIVALHRLFTETKWTQQRFDYDDLLLMIHRLFMEAHETASQLAQSYRAILVDEYQDSTRLQAEIVRLMSALHQNVMVVGDDAQSIFSFRSADVHNMHEFHQLFPHVQIYKLEQNYRSTKSILAVANAVIDQAQYVHPKTLFTTKPDGRRPELIACPDEHVQSEYVVDQIRQVQQQVLGLHRIAVL